jgi:Ni,Fe-hydrogenase III large subunit
LKSLILHDAWPEGFKPLRDLPPTLCEEAPRRHDYRFLTVRGEGVYEIPVGPIHAGIIEPGHFRFSCLGEVIQNLEIRLGYQHRGVEQQLTEVPWQRARFLAEAASSDTSAGNAWAHAMAIEHLLEVAPPLLAQHLRALALEIERVASHLGDLGGICNDIGFAAGAVAFGCLRGRALGLGERLTGSRFLTSYIVPGGVLRGLSTPVREDMAGETRELTTAFARATPLLLENPGALERMEGTGKVRVSLARDFGLVGPAGRASGVAYDVRQAFRQEPYYTLSWEVAAAMTGDVLARVRIRVDETRTSLALIQSLLAWLPRQEEYRVPVPNALPPERVGVGVVEAWRGELIHLIFTDTTGRISRYCIKDPSFNNWTGLAIAARGQLVADFPLCNKSFGLSYSGNDL